VIGCENNIWLNADHRHLRQMFMHLFRNALEAMPEGGVLEVVVSRDDQWLRVAVRDNGLGMPEDYLDKVTDPFFTTKTYGTGMGFTLVEKILKTHGGNFSINKRPGGGLEVIVNLPLTLLINSPAQSSR